MIVIITRSRWGEGGGIILPRLQGFVRPPDHEKGPVLVQLQDINFWLADRGGSRIFSRGANFQTLKLKCLSTFLDRPINWFSERYQNTLFWLSFPLRKQTYKKTGQKCRFGHLLEFCEQKIEFFFRPGLLKFSIYWRPKRLEKNFRVSRLKWMSLNNAIEGTLWWARGRPLRRERAQKL